MENIILSDTNIDNLENQVDSALAYGWARVAGVSVVWDGKEKIYYQLMTQT